MSVKQHEQSENKFSVQHQQSFVDCTVTYYT